MKKLTVAEMRHLEQKVSRGEISYSRMVEIINEKFSSQEVKQEPVKDYFEEYQFEAGRVEDLQAEISQLKYQLSLFPEISPSQSTESPDSDKKAVEFVEWIRLRFQNSPLEFDNYWEDFEGFPNNTGKTYTTAELLTLFKNRTE